MRFFLADGREKENHLNVPLPERRSTLDEWLDTAPPPAERLVRFERWLRHELATRLQWSENPAKRQKEIGQAQRFVNGFLCDLNRRGWLFDGPLLAKIITDKLDDIAKRQKLGVVEDLWIYLRVVWSQYADAASEKLQGQAISAGFHISQIMAGLKTIPQATAERAEQISADKLAKARRKLRIEVEESKQQILL